MPESNLLTDLTEAQREAVLHFEGPLLILAGPGSGKTRVITRRVAWLLSQGVRAGNILAITFTNKAANEMRQRVEALVPGNRVWISTFHSFGARILRQYADRLDLDKNFTIYDQSDRVRIVKVALEDAGVDTNRFTPESVMGAISKAKNQLISPERYAAKAGDFFSTVIARVYPAYEKRLRGVNALDFDDLLYWPALAMRNLSEFRSELDERFRFVLIDEYQDTNHAQYAIARGLCTDQPNLCVVGDPDQSIYRFRGSDIRNILNFERDYPGACVITLDQNYRSTKSILHAADRLIENNQQRKPKALFTDNPQGEPVRVLTFETGMDEAEGIARRIREAVVKKRFGYRDFAVFLRVNALSRTLEIAFTKHKVPFQIVKGLAFFERKENKDVLAYLRLLGNPQDDLAFLRAVNEPARGVGKVSLDHLQKFAGEREISLLTAAGQVERIPAIKGKAAKGLREFARLFEDLKPYADAQPDEVMRQVLERSGYRKMLKASSDPDDQERLANIEELVTAAKQFTVEDENRSIGDFLENITLASDLDGWNETQDSVSVMTLHAAKGLEFPVVFMVAVEQGLLPHERSLSKTEEIEEERRLAFVGMTRAKRELYLCHARLREFRGQTLYAVPSHFLDELPADAIEHVDAAPVVGSGLRSFEEWRGGPASSVAGWTDAGVTPSSKPKADTDFAVGWTVKHDTYGTGRVTDINGFGATRRVKVRFARHGEKTFVVNKVKLEVVKRG